MGTVVSYYCEKKTITLAALFYNNVFDVVAFYFSFDEVQSSMYLYKPNLMVRESSHLSQAVSVTVSVIP